MRKEYIGNIEEVLNGIYAGAEHGDSVTDRHSSPVSPRDNPGIVPFLDWENYGEEWAKRRLQEIEQPKGAGDEKESDEPNQTTGGNADIEIENKDRPTYEDLNDGQRRSHDTFVEGVRNGKQQLSLIHGGPGTGKTFVTSVIVDSLQSQGTICRACSFMWSAVFQLHVACPKASIHTMFGLSRSTVNCKFIASDQGPRNLAAVRLRMGNASVIILDEVSCTDAPLFVSIDVVLKAAYPEKRELRFAGFSVLCLGDFCQLPPVSSSLASLLSLFSSTRGAWASASDPESRVSLQAAELMSHFKRLLLTEQMRAAEDAAHTAMIDGFSLNNTTAPLTQAHVANMQRLSSNLLLKDPAFYDAKVAVQSNEERRQFNRLMTISFAKRLGQPVFRWLEEMRVGRAGNSAGISGAERSRAWVEAGCHELEVLFVRGMPVVISHQGKLGDESWGIANGQPGTAHSFAYRDSVEFTIPDDALGDTAAGSIIDIRQPYFVNVQLQEKSGKPGEVIPLKLRSSQDSFIQYLKHAPKSTRVALATATPSFNTHSLQPNFALTYNKLQGATLDRLVLVLNDLDAVKLGTMTVHKLYVALSRVRRGLHYAIYPARKSDLRYFI